MKSTGFKDKVKRHVASNFDQSLLLYQAFEEKHHFFSALALKLAESVGVAERSAILDVGCGYGVSAKLLYERLGCRVVGVDLSPKMIAEGRSFCDRTGIHLFVGDGEKLSDVVGDRRFDFVLYNASIFIFPDVSQTIEEAYKCLRTGGKIAFSFYPQLIGEENEALFDVAFQRLGEPLPRFLVITDYSDACAALKKSCGNVCHHRWVRPLNIEFLQDFFSIPAQSASLFPGRTYEVRRDLVKRLFATLGDMTGNASVIWRMAEGIKADGADRSADTGGIRP
jgi:SAM-dependent methyltransferase